MPKPVKLLFIVSQCAGRAEAASGTVRAWVPNYLAAEMQSQAGISLPRKRQGTVS